MINGSLPPETGGQPTFKNLPISCSETLASDGPKEKDMKIKIIACSTLVRFHITFQEFEIRNSLFSQLSKGEQEVL